MDASTTSKAKKSKAKPPIVLADAIDLLRHYNHPLQVDELCDRGFAIDDSIAILRAVQDAITEHAIVLAKRIAAKTVRKYQWIDGDDLQQELLIPVQRWIGTFAVDHSSNTSWSKYLYHKMNFYVKDVLRREDPVGIKWPQREHYPTWFRLGEQSGRLGEAQGDDGDYSTTQGGDCPTDLLGRTLELNVDMSAGEEDSLWQSDLEGLAKLAAKNRKRKQIPALIDCGSGVARALKCPFWDRDRGRVKFGKKSVTLADWIGQPSDQLLLF